MRKSERGDHTAIDTAAMNAIDNWRTKPTPSSVYGPASLADGAVLWLYPERHKLTGNRPVTLRTSKMAMGAADWRLTMRKANLREAQMHTTQIIPGSIFGSAYLHEYRADEAHSCWTPEAKRIDFEAVLKVLRSALSLRN
jgi:hypothetical protein